MECNSKEQNSKHFTCNNCLNEYVKSELDPENFAIFEVNGIICPYKKFNQCNDSTKFEEQILARHIKKETWLKYTKIIKDIMSMNTTKELKLQFDNDLEREIKRRERGHDI